MIRFVLNDGPGRAADQSFGKRKALGRRERNTPLPELKRQSVN
jgi:hypothetical protein